MTASRPELVALAALALCVSGVAFAAGAAFGAGWAFRESADRLSDAKEAQAQAALLAVDCHALADSCLSAVGVRR